MKKWLIWGGVACVAVVAFMFIKTYWQNKTQLTAGDTKAASASPSPVSAQTEMAEMHRGPNVSLNPNVYIDTASDPRIQAIPGDSDPANQQMKPLKQN